MTNVGSPRAGQALNHGSTTRSGRDDTAKKRRIVLPALPMPRMPGRRTAVAPSGRASDPANSDSIEHQAEAIHPVEHEVEASRLLGHLGSTAELGATASA